MKSKKIVADLVLMAILSMASCRSTAYRHDWTVKEPLAESQPWGQIISSITFSNMPLSEAIQTVQSEAHGVTISVSTPAVAGDSGPPNITFTAKHIPLLQALRIMASVADYGVLYRENQAVLVPCSHGDGCVVPIRISGQCVDGETGQPIRKIEIERVKYMGMRDPRLSNTKVPVRCDASGRFDVTVPVDGYDISYKVNDFITGEFYPYDQVLVLCLTSDNYIPQTHEIPVVHDQKAYYLDARLKKGESSK